MMNFSCWFLCLKIECQWKTENTMMPTLISVMFMEIYFIIERGKTFQHKRHTLAVIEEKLMRHHGSKFEY